MALSFAKTPQRPNIIQVTSYTTSSYVIHFKCAPNFGEPQGLEKEKCLRNGFEKLNFGLWYFRAAAKKALHSKTWLAHCTIKGGGCTISVGREVKMEIPDRSDLPKSWGKYDERSDEACSWGHGRWRLL
jgi:hypothetical protein